jgi:hypothetical protein
MISVVVRRDLCLTEAAWNRLVTTGAALRFAGTAQYRIPFTIDVILYPHCRAARPPDWACLDCWGTGLRRRPRRLDDRRTRSAVRVLLHELDGLVSHTLRKTVRASSTTLTCRPAASAISSATRRSP